MLPHNALGGKRGSVGKIRINFAPVASVNAKTSHGRECGWLAGCQPWLYDCFLPPFAKRKHHNCARGPHTVADGRQQFGSGRCLHRCPSSSCCIRPRSCCRPLVISLPLSSSRSKAPPNPNDKDDKLDRRGGQG